MTNHYTMLFPVWKEKGDGTSMMGKKEGNPGRRFDYLGKFSRYG